MKALKEQEHTIVQNASRLIAHGPWCELCNCPMKGYRIKVNRAGNICEIVQPWRLAFSLFTYVFYLLVYLIIPGDSYFVVLSFC